MWGPSIVGFVHYLYRYDSGREGESMLAGFSPRKANLVVYVLPGYGDIGDDLAVLGKHKIATSCLYIDKLDDVDVDVLAKIVTDAVAKMRRDYETFDRWLPRPPIVVRAREAPRVAVRSLGSE